MIGSAGGGISVFTGSVCTGENNIVYGNDAWQNPDFSGIVDFDYSCVPNLSGGTGNIQDNPRFVDPASSNYSLQAGSPCIDAGDPNSALDPDGTRADMGALYYDQGTSYPAFTVSLTYVSGSPVPAGGGPLVFDIYVVNDSGQPQDYDAWLAAEYEGGTPTTLVLRVLTNFQPGWAINRPNTYYPIPGAWAAGNYEFFARVGDEPNTVWHEDSFPFTKSGASAGGDFVPYPVSGAPNPFESVQERTAASISGHNFIQAYPNPFNPTCTINYQIEDFSYVNLSVYDVTGSEVLTLVDGWRPAGMQQATFDGSTLASGVYFCQLQAGKAHTIYKLMLIK